MAPARAGIRYAESPARDARSPGYRLRAARLASGLSQRQLAAEAGVSLGAVRDLEQGRSTLPSWQTVRRLTEALRAREAESVISLAILGPLRVASGHTWITITPGRQRTVLGLLAICHPTGVSVDELVEALWNDRPPRTATTIVHGCVSRLRHSLGTGLGDHDRGWPISMTARRYRLADEVTLDLTAFLSGAARAADAAERGHYELSCRLYQASLEFWRGPVLADVDVPRHHPVLVGLAHRHCDVVMRFARIALSSGVPGTVLPHLWRLCGWEPYHESAHAALMTALAAAGRTAEAIDIFGRFSRRLSDDLGIRPCGDLMAVYSRILQQLPGRSSPGREQQYSRHDVPVT